MNCKKYHVSKNLFDKDNATVKTLYIDSSLGTFRTSSNAKTVTMPCEPNTTYTVSKILSARFSVAYSAQIPVSGDTANGAIDNHTGTNITITTDNNARYLSMFIYNLAYDTATFEDIENSVMVNEGPTPLPYEPYSSEVWHDIPYYIHKTDTDTLTTLPADLYADGNNATIGLVGNMSQTGTPTPSSPIQPQETGERTGQLFDKNTITIGKYKNTSGETTAGNGAYSDYIEVNADTDYYLQNGISLPNFYTGVAYDENKTVIDYIALPRNTTNGVIHTPLNCKYIIINMTAVNAETVMLNTGGQPLPYEPYGIKIPISSANTTTPVYLGEVETTRKIKKLVLTGEEDTWIKSGAASNTYYFNVLDYLRQKINITVCSHYTSQANINGGAEMQNGNVAFYANPGQTGKYFYVRDGNFATLEDLKTYLQQQYAAGTPVCVWYVLAEPTTAIVNEPLRKIGDYADTVSGISIPTITGADSFDVLTTLKPSEVTANYHGWHVGTVHERESGQWD